MKKQSRPDRTNAFRFGYYILLVVFVLLVGYFGGRYYANKQLYEKSKQTMESEVFPETNFLDYDEESAFEESDEGASETQEYDESFE